MENVFLPLIVHSEKRTKKANVNARPAKFTAGNRTSALPKTAAAYTVSVILSNVA